MIVFIFYIFQQLQILFGVSSSELYFALQGQKNQLELPISVKVQITSL